MIFKFSRVFVLLLLLLRSIQFECIFMGFLLLLVAAFVVMNHISTRQEIENSNDSQFTDFCTLGGQKSHFHYFERFSMDNNRLKVDSSDMNEHNNNQKSVEKTLS